MRKKIWISWEIQQRNRSMSEVLGAHLYELTSGFPRILKYPILSFQTLILLLRNRDKVVFLQNPSIVLCVIGVLFKKIFGIVLVVDEHNAGLFPLEGKNRFLNLMAKMVVKESSLVIVTNENLRRICEFWGGNAYVMPDPIPQFPDDITNSSKQSEKKKGFFTLLFICSWADDEPYSELLLASQRFCNENVRLVVSGNYKKKADPNDWPHVDFTGFIPRHRYLEELKCCDSVIVLTNRDNCLNCGAYEAVAAGKPGLLSDKTALRRHFKEGFVFTDNSVEDISKKVKVLIQGNSELSEKVKYLREDLNRDTKVYAKGLVRIAS